MKIEIPVWEKSNLTVEEAAAYFGIGENRIRKLASNPNCSFVLWVGSKCLIKKACFEEFLKKSYSIQEGYFLTTKTRYDSNGALLNTGEYERSFGKYEYRYSLFGTRFSVYDKTL